MTIEESVLKVGGRPLLHRLGKSLNNIGTKMMNKHKQLMITNPTFKIANPFTLIISFTVEGTDKYQLVIQGDYKKLYKETGENTSEISDRELFIIIGENQYMWFKKE
jgi:hypothetical protein